MTALNVCLWLSPDDAPKAVALWTSLIPHSRVVFEDSLSNPAAGDPRMWQLEIAGSTVHVMGAANNVPFAMSTSMWLVVADQAELDHVWDGFLAAGGTEMACGWIVDPFGVSWQVVPEAWLRLTKTDDRAQAQRVAEALWGMIRPDVAALEAAAARG